MDMTVNGSPTLWSCSRRQAVMAAVDLAAKTAPKTVELAPAVMRYGVQRVAVLGLRWRQVASVAEKRAAETEAAMAEAGQWV